MPCTYPQRKPLPHSRPVHRCRGIDTLHIGWIGAFVLATSLVTPVLRGSDPGKGNEASHRVVPGVRQLFLDDLGIAQRRGLARTMHRPRKRGAVIRSPNPKQTVQTRTAPVWDPAAKRL